MKEILERAAEYILSAQTPEGGLADRPLNNDRLPFRRLLMIYNFAAIGLLHFYDITKNKKYLTAVKKWIKFWAERQNLFSDRFGFRGTFYDYKYDPQTRTYKVRLFGNESAANKGGAGYDSSDAYPSIWLLVLLGYFNRTKDKNLILKLKQNIHLASESILITWNEMDTTWCHPNWKFVYMMDECETYAGLISAAKLLKLAGAKGWKAYQNFAQRLKNSILKLWDPKREEFWWGYRPDGRKIKTNWKRWFPDVNENLWPILWEIVPPDSPVAKIIWEKTNRYHPEWFRKQSMKVQVGVVACKMGDLQRAEEAMNWISKTIEKKAWESLKDPQKFGIVHELGLLPLLYKGITKQPVKLLEV